MSSGLIVVKAAYDAEAGVWFVETSDIPGLNLEAASVEELVEKLPPAIHDLLESDGDGPFRTGDVAIEVIAHASTRLTFDLAA
ncbi:DUF1902 domain-containing protein [Hansschlegelia quercus]|uniref:DUF1902 domain-containing protein n=1 Tax=Hansschlegelia quercus TaxID=2528245 RepID=A0A4Q9GF38_9HYPH|nr:DUF1902 domain-containing protein [Hansschlegelia quercus]TBN48662.1 DUF1902 domain-containing protein [Hansschlegelia quercus]